MIATERLRRLSPGRLPLPRLPRPAVLVLLAMVLLLGGVWLWLRDSSLVSVRHIRIQGESGPDAAQIRQALSLAARNMTTLDVRLDQLRAAVAPYPVVRNLQVSTDFPHGMRIHVVEQIPVGAVSAGG
ncbi:MAG: FtsQ-type POTRA domain-containing protein, partial [Actinomycetota bacterium]|nr:FtsQ-type POTRA domain-containing protein [Actinomycetota bacterium]